MSYKALFSTEDCINTRGSNVMLMQAIEDAVNDGAHVINNSWGGSAGDHPANSPFKTMYEAAEEAGVVIVTAAGNDGSGGAQTIGCPGCIESGITVANSTTGRYFANKLTVDNKDYLAMPAYNSKLSRNIELPIIAASQLTEGNTEACAPFTDDSFKNAIALVSRGTCDFSKKAAMVQAAGAKALVIHNTPGSLPFSIYVPNNSLPVIMITAEAGNAITSFLSTQETTARISAEIERFIAPTNADIVVNSSSRGPNGDFSVLKPDITAPGTDILSAIPAINGELPATAIFSGTSMASPHVAGAAALLRQLNPNWTANDIKTALTSTATSSGILDEKTFTEATVFAKGAGRLDLDRASQAVLTFDRPSLASDCVGLCTYSHTVHNKSGHTTTWDLSFEAGSIGETFLEISPSTLELQAGESAQFHTKADVSLSEDESWILGDIWLKSREHTDAHLPVAILSQHSSNSNLISVAGPKNKILANDEIPISARFNNLMFNNSITIEAQIPNGTVLTSVNDVNINIKNGQQYGLNIDEAAGKIIWSGQLQIPKLNLTKTNQTNTSIFNLPSLITPECEQDCDDVAFTLNTPNFLFNSNIYSKITISDNGLVLIGGGSTAGTNNNTPLPDTMKPNNILAPLWADFSLSENNRNNQQGGQVGIALAEQNDKEWIVIEWNNVKLVEEPNAGTYTFSIWISTSEQEEITFNYINIPAMPSQATIGAEDISGANGDTLYFNSENESVAVTSGEQVQVEVADMGQLEINYQVQAKLFEFGSQLGIETDEEQAVTINILENANTSARKVAQMSATSNGTTFKALDAIEIHPNGNVGNPKLVSPPDNGTVVISHSGIATYTPVSNFFGVDTFTYTVEDQTGNVSTPIKASIVVNNINDAPTMSLTKSVARSKVGQAISLKSNAIDLDGDSLNFLWTQTAGAALEFDSQAENIVITPTKQGNYSFSLEVTDSSSNVIESINFTVENKDDDGGAMHWLISVLMLLGYRLNFSRKT